MLKTTQNQLFVNPVDPLSSVSILLVINDSRQVLDSEITHLEACEILWLLSLAKKYGFAAVEETLVQYLLAPKNNDYTV